MKPSRFQRIKKVATRALSTFRPTKPKGISSPPSQLIVKSQNGIRLWNTNKRCDECKQVRNSVSCFSKSNRNFKVFVCDECLYKVLERSFPDRFHVELKATENASKKRQEAGLLEGIGTPRDDALRHSTPGGLPGLGRRN